MVSDSIETTGTYAGAFSTSYDSGSTANGEWLNIDLGSPIVLSKYKLGSGPINEGYTTATNWIVLGSNDNSNWKSIDLRIGETMSVSTEPTEFVVTNNYKSYRYS